MRGTREVNNSNALVKYLLVVLVVILWYLVYTTSTSSEVSNIVEKETEYAEVYKMMQYLDDKVEKQGEYGVLRKGQQSQLYILVSTKWQYMSDETRQPKVLQMLEEVKQGKEKGYDVVVVYPELQICSPDTLSQMFGTYTERATDWEWEIREKLADCESIYLRKLTSKLQVGEWVP